MKTNPQEVVTLTTADHLVGNLWFDLECLPLIASILDPEVMRTVAPGPAATAYSEMCRLLRSSSEQLSAGALEANLKAQGFDFKWLRDVQSRIEAEDGETLQGYARQILNAAELRRIQVACHEAAKAANRADADASVVAGDLLKALVPDKGQITHVEHISAATARLRKRNEQLRSGDFAWGAKTGFKDLDRIFRMVDGDLIMVGGRPSQGKTSMVRQILYHRALELHNSGEEGQVVFFSADDTADKVTDGLACALAKVDSSQMYANQLTDEEWERIEQALAHLDELPLYIDETPSPTVDTIRYRCAMLHAKAPIRLAAGDYIELFQTKGRDDKLTQLEDVARGIKGIAKDYGFPFILVSQLRKAVDERADKMPTAADLKYAGEAEADTILLCMRPEHYLSRGETCEYKPGDEEGVAIVNIAKNKRGRVGVVRLAFVKQWSRFFDLARRDLNEFLD